MMDHKKSLYRFRNVNAVLMVVLMACSPHHYHSTAVAFAYTSGMKTRTHTRRGPRSTTITSIRSSKNNHTPPPYHAPPRQSHSHSHSHSHKDEITKIPWLIIGGGIHGVHIAARLLGSQSGGMDLNLDPDPANSKSKSNLCIVDAHEHLLHTWKSRTAATGMEYLRSSAGYHLDPDENSLRDQFGSGTAASAGGTGFRKRKKKERGNTNTVPASFSRDYERPRLDVFNQHCDCVIEKYGLENLHTRGVVTAIEPHKDHVRVVVSLPHDNHDDNDNDNDNDNDKHVVYNAEHVVLALGNDDPSYAEWVDTEDIEQGLVHHLLEDQKTRARNNPNDASDTTTYSVAVVGGGITAAHKALELVHDAKATKIHLISRHPLKEQQFDTHQDWMMDLAASKRSEEGGGEGIPKRQRLFSQSACWKERRRIIGRERVAGTVTPAVNRGARGLKYAIQKGDIQWHQAEVLKKCYIESDSQSDQSPSQSRPRMELSLSSGTTIEVDEILLATGFGKKLPGGTLLQNDLVEKAGLEVSEFCGFPIVDENLLWHSRIFVAGALAELELGPSARNIAGARLAAERIVRKARSMDPLASRS